MQVKDLDTIEKILDDAKRNMREVLKIDQWQAGYPNRDTFENDISKGYGYVFCDQNDTVVGAAAVIIGNEPLYDKIQTGEFTGVWQGDEKTYAAVHRFCVALDITKRGVGSSFMLTVADFCKKSGCESIRIDTHRYNKAMRRMLSKCDFHETGIIYIPEPNSNERITYEKIL